MPELQRLRDDHGPAVLAFERENRAYFAQFISDRGDAFFEQFDELLRALVAEQDKGVAAYHVLVDDDGSVLGRFNLIYLGDDAAELGYRVAQRASGRGVATAAVQELGWLAVSRYGLRTLRARTTQDNVASQRVLAKAGFAVTGPTEINGQAATWWERDLTAG